MARTYGTTSNGGFDRIDDWCWAVQITPNVPKPANFGESWELNSKLRNIGYRRIQKSYYYNRMSDITSIKNFSATLGPPPSQKAAMEHPPCLLE